MGGRILGAHPRLAPRVRPAPARGPGARMGRMGAGHCLGLPFRTPAHARSGRADDTDGARGRRSAGGRRSARGRRSAGDAPPPPPPSFRLRAPPPSGRGRGTAGGRAGAGAVYRAPAAGLGEPLRLGRR
eukprot:gene19857-biopygen20562